MIKKSVVSKVMLTFNQFLIELLVLIALSSVFLRQKNNANETPD